MLVDSHCHLDFPDFGPEQAEIVERARAAGVETMVTISTRIRRYAQITAIAEAYPDVWCSVGTHPHNAGEEDGITTDEIVRLSAHPKCVAIGEAGLDYFYDKAPRDAQARGFRAHIAAARETGLPLVIHARDADADVELAGLVQLFELLRRQQLGQQLARLRRREQLVGQLQDLAVDLDEDRRVGRHVDVGGVLLRHQAKHPFHVGAHRGPPGGCGRGFRRAAVR